MTRRKLLLGAALGSALRTAPKLWPRFWNEPSSSRRRRSIPIGSALLMQGLLDWGRHGIGEVREFTDAWLSFHLSSKRLSPYSARSREINAGGITITTYAGHYGLAVSCYELAKQNQDRRAARICRAIADIHPAPLGA
jgi:hypothetical protein